MPPEGRAILVTGTDTDVGKTVATAWLASRLAPGRKLAIVKPAQTGTVTPAEDGDEAFYRRALGHAAADVTVRTLVSVPEPLAPSIAAKRAGITIDVPKLVAECLEIAANHDLTLFEGAGGLLVTLDNTTDYAGLATLLNAELVVVARPALGTLNHTLLTLEAAERRGLPVRLLVISGYPENAGIVEQENLVFLRQRLPDLPILVLGHTDLSGPDPLAEMEAGMLECPEPPWGLSADVRR